MCQTSSTIGMCFLALFPLPPSWLIYLLCATPRYASRVESLYRSRRKRVCVMIRYQNHQNNRLPLNWTSFRQCPNESLVRQTRPQRGHGCSALCRLPVMWQWQMPCWMAHCWAVEQFSCVKRKHLSCYQFPVYNASLADKGHNIFHYFHTIFVLDYLCLCLCQCVCFCPANFISADDLKIACVISFLLTIYLYQMRPPGAHQKVE